MDFRRLLTTIVIVGVAVLAMNYVMRAWQGPKPEAAKAATAEVIYPTLAVAPVFAEGNAKPETLRLGDPSKNSKDKVAVTINNVTACVDLVELNANDYTETVKGSEPLRMLEAPFAVPPIPKPYATIGVHITLAGQETEVPLGTHVPQADATHTLAQAIHDMNATYLVASQCVWRMEKVGVYEADLYLTITNHGAPLVQIKKIFRVDPASYDISVSHEVKNLSNAAIKVAIDQMAATDLPLDKTQSDDRFYHAAGLKTSLGTIDPDRFNFTHAEVKNLVETREIGSFLGNDPLEWVAASGRFFVAITRPTQDRGPVFKLNDGRTIPSIDHVASANIDVLKKSAVVQDTIAGLRLTGAPVEIAPDKTISMPLAVYLGPKKADVLKGDLGAAPGSETFAHYVFDYNTIIQFKSGSCLLYSFCTWGFLGDILVAMLTFLAHWITFGNYGFAIILLTIIIRALLHPLTRASQVNMATMGKKMKDIQPLIEANKKKYAKDKQKQNEEMMRIYKEHHVNPAGGLMGCLPMLIQMPIWIAMWSSLRTNIDLFHAGFIPGWINDLSAPDMTVRFPPFHLPVVGWEVSALNVLPLLLGVVFFIQMQVQTASQPKPADEQQAQMQKMTKYMSLMFPLFLYNLPSGLNLYYFASTLGGLVDTYFVRKTLKRKGILPANAKALPTHEEKDEQKD